MEIKIVEEKTSLQKAADDAIFVQQACNLGGVANAFQKAVMSVWEEAHRIGKGTDWVNRHPIIRLFLEQMAWLNCVSITDRNTKRDYFKCYDICEKIAKGEEVEIPEVL